MKTFLALLILFGNPLMQCLAKDLGVHGDTFTVEEPNLLHLIEEKLEKIGPEKLQSELEQRTLKTIERPRAVTGISHTSESRTFYFDPMIQTKQAIFDHNSNVLHPGGKKIQPMNHFRLSKTLMFIDGDDEVQIDWAMNQVVTRAPYKIILTRGSPINLMNKYKTRFYFDQFGRLTKKLGIKQVPARVSQEGKRLKIEEIKL